MSNHCLKCNWPMESENRSHCHECSIELVKRGYICWIAKVYDIDNQHKYNVLLVTKEYLTAADLFRDYEPNGSYTRRLQANKTLTRYYRSR